MTPAQAWKWQALPLGTVKNTNELAVALRDPSDLETIDQVSFAAGTRIHPASIADCELRERGTTVQNRK